ncbi:MAG: hypothetical protein F6K40_00555 [Okeania sp. SIO3I5]|uniref:hypothetical protein n=1 Tax=Okeania sp. SIO3I5 TaxID=2607805 RepID=UPI0013B75BBC|nr:hypothetical protein [Okeania sp. SIO3I5]NEQ34878.1 hypothetical protein [Okeania sp. SIO3I5]
MRALNWEDLEQEQISDRLKTHPKPMGMGVDFPRSERSPLTSCSPKSQLAREKTTRQKKIRFCLDKLKKQVFNSKKLAYGKCEGWKAIASSGRINLYLS